MLLSYAVLITTAAVSKVTLPMKMTAERIFIPRNLVVTKRTAVNTATWVVIPFKEKTGRYNCNTYNDKSNYNTYNDNK